MIGQKQAYSQPPSGVTLPIRIWLFGSFRMSVQGVDIANFRSNKTRALFCYLLLTHPKPQLRSDLATLFWPDYLAKSAQSNLRQTLSNLRDILAPFDLITADRNHVSLHLDPAVAWCDALHFMELLASCQLHPHPNLVQCPACRASLQQAVALYQGKLLEKFPGVDSPAFHGWLQAQQQRFAADFAEAQAVLAKPSKALGNLPPALTPLIGRVSELLTLKQKLYHPVYRCVSLVGPGGIGKTRLACAVGAELQPHFPDGVWLVDVGALTSPPAEETPTQAHDHLATVIGVALGFPFHGAARPTEQLENYLAAQQALLILDSFEHISAGAAWLPTLLAAAPQLRLLITTRHRLPMQSQIVIPLEGLTVPPVNLPVPASAAQFMAQYTSALLFVERATNTQPHLVFDTPTLTAIAQICAFVQGSPWAIELAVALLDQQSPTAVLAAVQQNYRVLTTKLIDLPARQRSAEAVFQTSWQLLTPQEAQTLACCAIFQGGFTFDAAQTIVDATTAAIDALVHKSLLHANGNARYTMHELVRQFAGEQLAQQADLVRQTQERHAGYYLTLVAGWQPTAAVERAFRLAVQVDRANVETAWAWALAHNQHSLLLAAVEGLMEFYQMTSAFHAAETLLTESVAQVRSLCQGQAVPGARPELGEEDGAAARERTAQQLLATLLVYQSDVCVGLAQLVQARAAADEALILAETLGIAKLIVRCYYVLAVVALSESQFERSQRLGEKGIQLARQHGLWREEAFCCNIAGIAATTYQHVTTVHPHQTQALLLVETHQDTRLTLRFRTHLGAIYRSLGDFSAALHCFEQNLAILRLQDDSYMVVLTHLNWGALLWLLGDYAAAAAALVESSKRLRLLGQKRLLAQCLALLGALRLAQGNYGAAAAACRQALDHQHVLLIAQQIAWLTLGDLHQVQGEFGAAERAYNHVVATNQAQDEAVWLVAQGALATVLLAREGAAAALTALEALLPHFVRICFDPIFSAQRFLFSAYQILVANQDPRAAAVLHQAWQLITASAARISDHRLRQTYLTQVALHRTIGQLIDAQCKA